MKMDSIPIPGEYIREEIEAREWNQRDLAYILGWPEQTLNMILSGKRRISPEDAKELGKAFDVPAELFINMQRAHDLSKAKEPDPGIQQRAYIQSVYPLREMIKRGWLEDSDYALLEAQFTRFFQVKELSEIPHLEHAAKKSGDYRDEMTPKQLAWLFRVNQIAKSIKAPVYSEEKLRELLPTIRYLMVDPADIEQVPGLLLQCGVRFVIVEYLPGAKIDGVCFWLNDSAPVIGMSLWRDRIDNFWFTLHHEIEHVLRKDGLLRPMIDEELSGSVEGGGSEVERVANLAAAERCVPIAEMNDFLLRKGKFVYERDVLGFAKTKQIHPGIVVGQIHARRANFSYLQKYLVKIKRIVTQSAVVDGLEKGTYPVEL